MEVSQEVLDACGGESHRRLDYQMLVTNYRYESRPPPQHSGTWPRHTHPIWLEFKTDFPRVIAREWPFSYM